MRLNELSNDADRRPYEGRAVRVTDTGAVGELEECWNDHCLVVFLDGAHWLSPESLELVQ